MRIFDLKDPPNGWSQFINEEYAKKCVFFYDAAQELPTLCLKGKGADVKQQIDAVLGWAALVHATQEAVLRQLFNWAAGGRGAGLAAWQMQQPGEERLQKAQLRIVVASAKSGEVWVER
jgi:hypothetical protein